MNFPVELPEKFLNKAKELGINPGDITEKLVKGGGKGGQKINTTASCVMLVHGPTGTVIKCQKHREQSKNRISAYKRLINKIEDQIKGKESERAKKIYKKKKQKKRRSRRAKEKTLKNKAHRSKIKERRKPVDPPEEY